MKTDARPLLLVWPLPALLAWAACWAACLVMLRTDLPAWTALLAATGLGVACGLGQRRRWRRLMVAGGFPLSFATLGAAAVPAWAWLLPLVLLLLLYPVGSWRDAPLFPTPRGALLALADAAPLPAGAPVLDAGCGLGAGLQALRAAYPQARFFGTEWSWPLRLACALRCPWARVRQGDIWKEDWSSYTLVYLFQRPESMARAGAKAAAELAPGAWLVSLEFPLPQAQAGLTALPLPPFYDKPVWVYRHE